jgi:hypothetical protein
MTTPSAAAASAAAAAATAAAKNGPRCQGNRKWCSIQGEGSTMGNRLGSRSVGQLKTSSLEMLEQRRKNKRLRIYQRLIEKPDHPGLISGWSWIPLTEVSLVIV